MSVEERRREDGGLESEGCGISGGCGARGKSSENAVVEDEERGRRDLEDEESRDSEDEEPAAGKNQGKECALRRSRRGVA